MECFYVEEVFEQIDEEIEFFEGLASASVEGSRSKESYNYALSILKHMRMKMGKLTVKEFQYGE